MSADILPVRIRDAATTIVVRADGPVPRVLMGQRGKTAAFMPEKFVFPGGAVDPFDGSVPFATPLDPQVATRLSHDSEERLIPALAGAAIRELWEETGLALGRPGTWTGEVPDDWAGFAAAGLLPAAGALDFVFRAITPDGRPRRFDARFFLVDAAELVGDLDDFSRACDELSDLQWIPLPETRSFNLPFVTEVVLGEISRAVREGGRPASVPFFDNRTARSVFSRIG
ncbi:MULTISPECIES: NUDIX hydrolase [unclassified Haematobacter]|uniref:NUDIX hydrolase n=1 Tax=unclassified Haematobacter TaxID=2640585 RepID=UPI0025C69EA8|nr:MULTISPECIES: NUDIX hydrolase [unclassified Haematobacter]